ncbi:hypothetical protein IWX90DRAFT_479961 [Phyllosticta citrichinensis]|uniref:Atos-like conserved domain-containing protein n=1 Tax=Phyllosticta citrichinensis TaxID=1130410 RepID=A0ABR1XKG6_9PEZI
MPIFHDYHHPDDASQNSSSGRRSQGEQSRPGNGSPGWGKRLGTAQGSGYNGHEADSRVTASAPSADLERRSSLDRVALIERLKRNQSPTSPRYQDMPVSAKKDMHHDGNGAHALHGHDSTKAESAQLETPGGNPTSGGSFHFSSSESASDEQDDGNMAAGLSIQRPRSALHSGDFRQEKFSHDVEYGTSESQPAVSTSPVAPWHHSFPAPALPQLAALGQEQNSRLPLHSRTPSQAPRVVLLPPTSPLVQQSNNTDLDWSPRPRSRQSRSPEHDNRRHTFSPQSLQSYHSRSIERTGSHLPSQSIPYSRRGGPFPYQAHQPRRSLSTFQKLQPTSTPHTPLVRPRGPSVSSEISPLQHAPMVGSYEESILRGRMSTTPSRPLNFICQIGVLGRGNCKPQLRCPAHVALPFPAVFYSYNSGNGRIADNQPSPYVGLVDLENNLKKPETNERRRRKRHARSAHDIVEHHLGHGGAASDRQSHEKDKASPKCPLGGSYRIPQKGQLQIVIKNPNKTAVKLFLLPYDLSDMDPGHKTFIRQRSYSAGPIIDMPVSSRSNLVNPGASLSASDDPNDRPTLRYLIHLHICCPSKDRYYLYKSIRVVFANRVPDGKEKLRNEIQFPDPRYSAYKPTRENVNSPSHNFASSSRLSVPEKTSRHRGGGRPLHLYGNDYDRLDGLDTGRHSNSSSLLHNPQIVPIPFSLPQRKLEPVVSRAASMDQMDVDSQPGLSSRHSLDSSTDSSAWEKFAKESLPSPPQNGAGLLAQRLRGLDVQKGGENEGRAV